MRLIIVHNIPAPYRIEFFNALAAHPAIDSLHVIFCAPRLEFRPWKQEQQFRFSYEILKDYPLRLGHPNFFYHFNPGILQRLNRYGKDWIWINYSYIDPTCIIASIWRNIRKWPWILMTEAPNLRSRTSMKRQVIRRILLQPAICGSRGIIVLGAKEGMEYFRQILPSYVRLFCTPYYLDITPHLSYGERRVREWARDPHAPLRFMYAGQLASYSNVETIIRAFIQVAQEDANSELHLVGDGAHRPILGDMVPSELRPSVIFHGGKDWHEMPSMYGQADVLVHASLWQAWGMVISEALASGLPVIASRTTGAATHLIIHGVNGFLFESTDDKELAKHMLYFCHNRNRLREFAVNAVQTAQTITLDKGVQEFVDIVIRLTRQ